MAERLAPEKIRVNIAEEILFVTKKTPWFLKTLLIPGKIVYQFSISLKYITKLCTI